MLRSLIKTCVLTLNPLIKRKYCKLQGATYQSFSIDNYIPNIIEKDFILKRDFITNEEENNLIDEIDTLISRQKYQEKHWDYAIRHYRELEQKHWRTSNAMVISRLKEAVFNANKSPKFDSSIDKIDQVTLPLIHVLDLAENGEILPHIDSIRFCGDAIAVLSLLDNSVLRLAVAPQSEVVGIPNDRIDLSNLNLPAEGTYIDIQIPKRSLYVICGAARYLFTHSILSNNEVSKLSTHSGSNGEFYIKRHRRVSIIARSKPVPSLLKFKDTSTDLERELSSLLN